MNQLFPERAPFRSRLSLVLTVMILLGFACVVRATPAGPAPREEAKPAAQTGIASWHQGDSRTASGRRWRSEELVAAHRTLPLGSAVRVTNVRNGRETVVLITDRGPYAKGRIIDLSVAAARQIDCLNAGTAPVRLEVVRLARFNRVASTWVTGKP